MTIGNDVIIVAGAVVTHDIQSGTIYSGVPARKIGQFNEYKQKSISLANRIHLLKLIRTKRL